MPRLTPQPQQSPASQRVANLGKLLGRVEPLPQDVVEREKKVAKDQQRLRPLPCRSWSEVVAAWADAVRWRQGLQDILVASLAVSISTQQQGEQIFLLVGGPPGAGKTRLVSALLVSDHCEPFENFSGLFSGWRSGFGDDDYSMLASINGKTLITPEGDVLVKAKDFPEKMSHLRRIFDGNITQRYKTLKNARRYDGLRTPIIVAGTHVMIRAMSQPALGDRFIRVFADQPNRSEERNILLHAGAGAWASVGQASNGRPDSQMSPKMTLAYRLTGGYVDHLRERASEIIDNVGGDCIEDCADLALYTSFLRGRPDSDPRNKTDEEARRELPARLVQQYTRLARCVAAVTGRPEVDDKVMRLVRKIAVDTSDSKMRTLCTYIHSQSETGGSYGSTLARWTGVSDQVMSDRLQYLREIGTLVSVNDDQQWKLSDAMMDVWDSVKGQH